MAGATEKVTTRFKRHLAEKQLLLMQPGIFNASVERTKCAPWGLFGGKDAVANRIDILRADGTVEEFENGKIYQLPLGPGDGYSNQSGGGGGFRRSVEETDGGRPCRRRVRIRIAGGSGARLWRCCAAGRQD